LEERAAEVLGVEAALYVTSGHMANQTALFVHGRPGESVIAHSGCHIFNYESGALCSLSGLQPRPIDTEDGTFTAEQLRGAIQPLNIHHAKNRIVALENTHNRCGGTVWPLQRVISVCEFAHEHGLLVHMDGARLWNACAATGTEPREWTVGLDSVSCCFSKGLGAPVGSVVCGSRGFVDEARFARKIFGGQMRQAGIIAAGALYALEHHRERLPEDHANAKLLAELVGQAPGVRVIPPQSNIVIFEISDPRLTAAQLVEAVAPVARIYAISERRIRMVTHLDVSAEQCRTAGEAVARALKQLLA
jgi:threonine aldolase